MTSYIVLGFFKSSNNVAAMVIFMQQNHIVFPLHTLEKGKQDGSRTASLASLGAGGGGGEPTRLCPGERTNGLVSLPRGSSAGPSATVGD